MTAQSTGQASRPLGRPRALTRLQVVDAALALLDESGMAAVSIRTLAGRLGVMPRTIYTYVLSKEDLLDAMAARFLSRAAIRPAHQDDEDWVAELARVLRAYYRLYSAHPHAISLLANVVHEPEIGVETVDANIALLAAAGFSPRDSFLISRSLNRFVTGCAHASRGQNDQGIVLADPEVQHLGAVAQQPFPAVDADEVFEHGLNLMLEAVVARLTLRLADPVEPAPTVAPARITPPRS
jgi:TetR/AcrR family tetracycline transcriptional repressor